jgi:TnpA family transposase
MEAKIKTFDAVAESRKWKESTARETQGMTCGQVLAYFDREAVRRRFQKALNRSRKQKTVKSTS